MKKIIRLSALLYFTISFSFVFAQAPEKMTYQAIIRDAGNNLVADQTVGMQISILQGTFDGSSVYSETHTPTTNINGLVSLEVGMGITGDVFSDIDWSDGPYFIKTETDPAGGTNYTISGSSELLSVPFALHAKSATSLTGGIDESDPIFGASIANDITLVDTTYWNNKLDTPVGAVANDLISYDGTNWVAKNAVILNNGGNQAQNNMQPYLAVNFIIALQGTFPSRSSDTPFLAEIIMFGGNFAPRGWAFCDGQILAISSNTALFSLLGTTYGGDGRTTFALPDLRGRAAIHAGTGPGLSQRRLGTKGGSETNTMTIQQMPSHNHTISYQ